MTISPEKLATEAEATGFRADLLEKAARLLAVLDAIRNHPFLAGKVALKGGTALNLFVFNVPRLSVDIDLNYVGARSRDAMLEERPKIEEAIQSVFRREDFAVRRMPKEHAGGKWSLRYRSTFGQSGRLDVDLNFMYRVPLWPVTAMDSHSLGSWRATNIPVVNLYEIAAGKLSATAKGSGSLSSSMAQWPERTGARYQSRMWRSTLGNCSTSFYRCCTLVQCKDPKRREVMERNLSKNAGKGYLQCCHSRMPSARFSICCWRKV